MKTCDIEKNDRGVIHIRLFYLVYNCGMKKTPTYSKNWACMECPDGFIWSFDNDKCPKCGIDRHKNLKQWHSRREKMVILTD